MAGRGSDTQNLDGKEHSEPSDSMPQTADLPDGSKVMVDKNAYYQQPTNKFHSSANMQGQSFSPIVVDRNKKPKLDLPQANTLKLEQEGEKT